MAVYQNEGYQIVQSLFAIGTGGWFGMGLCQGSPEKIPVVKNDFIFSAICEELGGIFAICLILVCMSFFLMIVNIALKIKKPFYKLIALGLGTAGDADLGEHLGHLAALMDGNGGHAAAADDQNFAHVGYSFICKMVGSYLYLKARPALVQRDQGLAQHLAGGGGGNAGGVQRGGQLVQVCTDDVGLGHSADSIQQLQKAYAASLRGTGAREAGGVKAVKVDGQIHRHLALAQLCGQLGKTGKIKLVHLGVLRIIQKNCPVAAADAELVDVAVAHDLVAAAQHTGVAQLRTEVVVPQVGVGVEVDDVEVLLSDQTNPYMQISDFYRMMNNKVYVQFTYDLSVLNPFYQELVKLNEGRLFTTEEADAGAKVCVVSETVAACPGRGIGDFIEVKLFRASGLPLSDCYWTEESIAAPERYEIVGITNMIPYFGPFIGAIPSTIILLFISPLKAVIFVVMVFVLQQFDGLILGPKILGDSTGLKPLWIIFAITVGGSIAGVLGMFLGVPAVAFIRYLIQRLINHQLQKRDESLPEHLQPFEFDGTKH